MAQFREQVQITGRQAYIDLIHTLKITSLKLITDLMDAEEEKVLQSIRRTDGHHFMTGFTVHARASTSGPTILNSAQRTTMIPPTS